MVRWLTPALWGGGRGGGCGCRRGVEDCKMQQIDADCVGVWVFDAERTWSGVEWSEPW